MAEKISSILDSNVNCEESVGVPDSSGEDVKPTKFEMCSMSMLFSTGISQILSSSAQVVKSNVQLLDRHSVAFRKMDLPGP